jgi:hypothetical protein
MKKWLLLKILDVLNWLSEKVRDALGVEIAPRRSGTIMLSRTVQRHRYTAPISRTFSRRKFPAPIHIIGGDSEEDSE